MASSFSAGPPPRMMIRIRGKWTKQQATDKVSSDVYDEHRKAEGSIFRLGIVKSLFELETAAEVQVAL